ADRRGHLRRLRHRVADGAARRKARRPGGRHVVRSGPGGGARNWRAAGDDRQDDRHDPARPCRALSVDRIVRRVVMELNEEQFQRYARHLILDEVGEEGQEKLLAARILVVGAGGLGSPMLMYLAAAGVGTIGIIDNDRVDLTNLQRQIVHATERVGALKVDSARATLAAVNDGIRIDTHPMRLDADNAAELIAGYDLVADGSDNFTTRYLLT